MTAAEKHLFEALRTFIEASDMQTNIDTLQQLQRYLSCQVTEEALDISSYDSFIWLLHRLEDMLAEIKKTTDLTQLLSNRRN